MGWFPRRNDVRRLLTFPRVVGCLIKQRSKVFVVLLIVLIVILLSLFHSQCDYAYLLPLNYFARQRSCHNCNSFDFPMLVGSRWTCNISVEKPSSSRRNDFNVVRTRRNGFSASSNVVANNSPEDVSILFLIHSRPESIAKRKSIRSTWFAQAKRLLKHRADLLFVFGRSRNEDVEEFLQIESRAHGDIIQEDYDDNYDNMTLKAMSGLKHAAQRCSSARFVVKADDDVMINVPLLRRFLAANATNSSYVAGRCHNVDVVRQSYFFGEYNKWAVSRLEYPYDKYPRSCTGFFLVYSREAAERIVASAPHVPFFRFDDVYTTGLIGHEFLGIEPQDLRGIDGWISKTYDWCKFKAKKIAVHLDRKIEVRNMIESWKTLDDCRNYTEVVKETGDDDDDDEGYLAFLHRSKKNSTTTTYTFPDWV